MPPIIVVVCCYRKDREKVKKERNSIYKKKRIKILNDDDEKRDCIGPREGVAYFRDSSDDAITDAARWVWSSHTRLGVGTLSFLYLIFDIRCVAMTTHQSITDFLCLSYLESSKEDWLLRKLDDSSKCCCIWNFYLLDENFEREREKKILSSKPRLHWHWGLCVETGSTLSWIHLKSTKSKSSTRSRCRRRSRSTRVVSPLS